MPLNYDSIEDVMTQEAFDAFMGECRELAKDLHDRDPFSAMSDGRRVTMLISIAKLWHGARANDAIKGDAT